MNGHSKNNRSLQVKGNTMKVYACLTSQNQLLNVFDTLENAKEAFRITYSKYNTVSFMVRDTATDILCVHCQTQSSINTNAIVGYIQEIEVATKRVITYNANRNKSKV